ncbi:cupin domain-containing protein [Phragmitibacter flavus]|uniref:Cupin domain-containing protein n=1 Tax=Phragmitibacter flavus TaxID=2576071 RepID=A0A5R8KHL4_9BACT|nr:XRE family transcriptional regulator [Phragmitibacter flavus]TLD71757.1 cupin domain-containing protein [Phragmitibacter flavus]
MAKVTESVEEQIGQRIRALRSERNVTLDQLAVEVKLTKGQLSKIENGKVSSPVSTLTRIASALGAQVGTLFNFSDQESRAVMVRKEDRKEIAGRGSKLGHSYESLAFGLPFEKDFETYLMTIEEKKINPAKNIFKHPGHEFLYLLEGNMVYRHGSKSFSMRPGDSLFFDGTIEHGPVSVTGTPVRFLSIISNPRN